MVITHIWWKSNGESSTKVLHLFVPKYQHPTYNRYVSDIGEKLQDGFNSFRRFPSNNITSWLPAIQYALSNLIKTVGTIFCFRSEWAIFVPSHVMLPCTFVKCDASSIYRLEDSAHYQYCRKQKICTLKYTQACCMVLLLQFTTWKYDSQRNWIYYSWSRTSARWRPIWWVPT